MKIFTKRKFTQKLIIAFVCITMLNFCVTSNVQASIGGEMMSIVRPFVLGIGDVLGTLVQYGFTGKWIPATDSKGTGQSPDDSEYFPKNKVKYPILQISPELIFANEVEFLDANFITSSSRESYLLEVENDTTLQKLRSIIAGWYVTLRTISIVGLLSVLIYIGIRIIISSTSADKAKYKQRLLDWVIAFCLLFFMHYIMAATVTVVDKVNDMLGDATHLKDGLELEPEYGNIEYHPSTGTDPVFSNSSNSLKDWLTNNGCELKGIDTSQSELRVYNFEKNGQFNSITLGVTNERVELIRINNESMFSEAEINSIKEVIRQSNNRDDTNTTSPSAGEGIVGTVRPVTGGHKYEILASTDPSRILYFTNYARLYSEGKITDDTEGTVTAYIIIYIALIVFTVVFAFRYIKRVIYIAFLTLIAPTVALTYPLDKIKDRKSTGMEYVV